MRGKFLVFDGIDGCGKTTAIIHVEKVLKEEGKKILRTREPGGSPYAEKIRHMILAETGAEAADAETMFALFWASRRDHMMKSVLPVLKQGEHVLSDRFDSSTWGLQIRGQEQGQLRHLFWKVREHFLAKTLPDCYIIFDVEPEVAMVRAMARRGEVTHFDARDLAFQTRVREGFLEFVKSNHGGRNVIPHRIVNANLSIEEVGAQALEIVRSFINH